MIPTSLCTAHLQLPPAPGPANSQAQRPQTRCTRSGKGANQKETPDLSRGATEQKKGNPDRPKRESHPNKNGNKREADRKTGKAALLRTNKEHKKGRANRVLFEASTRSLRLALGLLRLAQCRAWSTSLGKDRMSLHANGFFRQDTKFANDLVPRPFP